MKKSFTERVMEALKGITIPAAVIATILTIGKNNLVEIVHSDNIDALKALPGIADKRSIVIINVLKVALMNGRLSSRAEKREKANGYSCRMFESGELWRDILALINSVKEYQPEKNESPERIKTYLTRKAELDKVLFSMPLTVRLKAGRIIRLNKSAISEVSRVDYNAKRPTKKIMVVEHDIQDLFDFHWSLFNNDENIAKSMKDEYLQKIEFIVMMKGVKVIEEDDNGTFITTYGGVASSSSHQKQEKILCVTKDILKANADFFWFGFDLNQFATRTRMLGAELWKARANLIRPWMKPFVTKSGETIRMKDILFVKDVEKIYFIKNGRKIGKFEGVHYKDGSFEEPKTLFDGMIAFLEEMMFQGQASSTGVKGFGFDATSSIEYLCEKYGMTLEEFRNLEVEGIDGKMHRVGDYKAIAGEGCWKLDKAFDSYESYMKWLEEQSKIHNGLDVLYLLRQAEEIEDEEKVRRLTKSLIQQWLFMSPAEINRITKKACKDLVAAKSFNGSVRKLAALWKSEEERTAVEKLFEAFPQLVMNPSIQNYLENSWNRKLIEAASCKFRTEGQYPYIVQDPVAMLETWILGKDPNADDLGILRGDEVSCADVPDGKEVLCQRFPANFLTAKVMKNRACIKAFESLNGVMAISIYSDIMITQDGDVDGDEMAVIYNKLAIELTKRMHAMYNPPVILFEHGSKAERHGHVSVEAFLKDCSDALWRAKRYDKVGIYANLAMKCAYLAAIAEKNGNLKKRDEALLWMSAASTGAILAIDQVKGNAVDEGLITWIEEIQKKVRKEIRAIAENFGISKKDQYKISSPYSHYFNELAKCRTITMEECLPCNEDNFVDMISDTILKTVGSWDEYDTQGNVWNGEEAMKALLYDIAPIAVKYGVITKEMVDLLGDNWFKFASKGKTDTTAETLRKIRKGDAVSMKEFMLLLWRNEASMTYTMEGAELWEKREEYYGVCRELVRMYLKSGNWVNQHAKSFPVGYEFSETERWQIAVNAIVKDALDPSEKGKIDNQGRYAMFCLRVFADDLLNNFSKYEMDDNVFIGSKELIESICLDIDVEAAEEREALFEDAPVNTDVDEEPPFDFEQVAPEENCWEISPEDIPE